MIGLIDSGAGGINVVNACANLFHEDFVFLVDNKNAPYGNKNKNKLKIILKNNINYLINKYKINILIIACNTLSSLIDKDFDKYNIRIITTNPPIKYVKNKNQKILIFATKNTIKNNIYVKYFTNKHSAIKTLYISNLAKLIDDNLNNKNNLLPILKKHFKKYKNFNLVILGCTHFAFIKGQIQKCTTAQIMECEPYVAKHCSYLVNNKKNTSSVKIELTLKDEIFLQKLKKVVDKKINIL